MCSIFLALTLYGSEAEYLGGTVKSIPRSMTGRLDLTDPADLLFIYGKGVYRLPFESIGSFELTPAKSLRRLPMARLPWSPRSEVLDLSFQGEDHATQVISFKLTGKDLPNTEWALKSRIQEPTQTDTSSGRIRLPESWWGDQFWRTTRNMTQRSPANSEPAGTK